MSIGNTKFHPSTIEDRIYDMMAEPRYIAGINLYTSNLLDDIINLFTTDYPECEWECFCDDWQNMCGQAVSLAWIEDGHLHLIGWDATLNLEDYYG